MTTTILKLTLTQALKEAHRSMTAYVLPRVAEFEDPEKSTGIKIPFILTVYINNKFYLIKEGLELLGDHDFYRAGMRLVISQDKQSEKITVLYRTSKAPGTWVKGATVNKVDLCFGQSVLVTAAPESGKSYMTRKIMDSFEFNPNATVHRLLFGERKDDDLGEGTIDCDSSATVEFQLYILYRELTHALREAHNGLNSVIAIDSLTRMVEQLTNKYAHSHMLSGGISASVKSMVGRLFRMAGQLGNGTLTIVGTCLHSRSNNTWKSIYSELSSIATAEFHPDIRSGARDRSRRVPDRRDNVFSLFGVDIHY